MTSDKKDSIFYPKFILLSMLLQHVNYTLKLGKYWIFKLVILNVYTLVRMNFYLLYLNLYEICMNIVENM